MNLQDRYTSLLENCTNSLKTWKSIIDENLVGSDKDAETEKLQNITKEFCAIDNNHENSITAIKSVEQAISDPSQTYNIDKMYKEKLSEQIAGDPLEHDIWKQLFANEVLIREVKHKKLNNDVQYEEVDDSLMCASTFNAPVDPISKTVIRKPVINKKCKHVYDGESIYGYIRQSKNKAKCPYMGCKNNSLKPEDLQKDKQLEEQITQFLESQQGEGSSDEDTD